MISTRRHLEFASGYIELGLFDEAADEIELVDGVDRMSAGVLSVRADLYMAVRQWDLLLAVARELTELRPADEKAWVYAAYALREMDRVTEARAMLLSAVAETGSVGAVVHYNLACYECLLGNMEEARRRLSMACKLGDTWKAAALDDPDLKAMWDEIAAM